MKETGSFQCSHPLINQFVSNVRWSQKSNFVDIPTDCPTRERVGWTADISVFAESACYLTDTEKFLMKWLGDYELEQQPDGNLPFTVPTPDEPNGTWGCMGWSNAIANIAMVLYQFYGKKEILTHVFDAAKKFVEFNLRRAKKQNLLSLFQPWKDREYVIDTGFHFGEWLEPGTSMVKDYIKDMIYPDTEVTTAWFYQTAEQLAEMADILGKAEDSRRYHKLAEKLRDVYRSRFLKHGIVSSKRQCRYVRPLAMGLADATEQKEIARRLDELCRKNDYRIGTGFLTTYQVLDVLADNGYVETAYRMLENTKQPGWLYGVKKGATTTWENWYGINEKGEPVDSQNHYAPGAVISWLFSRCAGIRPLKPGFSEVLIAPMPGGSLTWAKAEYISRKGKITSSWKLEDNEFLLEVQLPEGVSVRVELPDGERFVMEEATGTFRCRL